MTENAEPTTGGTTGDVRVDAALGLLAPLDQLAVRDHASVYDEVHRRLQDALATLDQG